MIKKNIIIIMVLLILGNTILLSQENISRHQISINASKFVLIFTEQVNNLDLTYRISLADTPVSLRAGTSLNLGSAENDLNDFSIRLGIDRVFKVSNKWKFYYGLDANYGKVEVKSTKRVTKKIGIIPLIGFIYNFGPNFSLSTEPSIALFRNEFIDNNSFNPNSSSTDFSANLINIGQIKVGFHF